MLKLFNTLTRQKEVFKPLDGKTVRLYTCGPTVYDFPHIGNLRTYVFEDIVRRTLQYLGYKVKHVMNITDVGHLISDADTGDDKMQKALVREGLPMTVESLRRLADRYTQAFLSDAAALNILPPHKMPKATDHVPPMIAMVQVMLEKRFAYETEQAIYFNVMKFPHYTQLSGQPLHEKAVGARAEVAVDPQKHHPADFALWFKLAGKHKNHVMHWPSPWGEGYPGWHIECSAMSREYLGFPFDIHCGGVDHITVHHANEIAQNEAYFGRPTVQVWMHGEYLVVDKTKMAKSAGAFLRLADVVKPGFNPLAFRYLCLQTHYRQQLNFSLPALAAAAAALTNVYDAIAECHPGRVGCAAYEQRFAEALEDDLNVPKALSVGWELIGDAALPGQAKRRTLEKFDSVLGLRLSDARPTKIPSTVLAAVRQRERARLAKNWAEADRLRQTIAQAGFAVEDTPQGPKVRARRK